MYTHKRIRTHKHTHTSACVCVFNVCMYTHKRIHTHTQTHTQELMSDPEMREIMDFRFVPWGNGLISRHKRTHSVYIREHILPT